MSMRRLTAAVAILLVLVYLRFCFPAPAQQMIAALQDMLRQEQVLLHLSEEVAAWLALK